MEAGELGCSLGRLQLVHHKEATGHLSLCLLSGARLFTIRNWRVTNALLKQAAERAETLKTHFEANISYTQLIAFQKFLRFFDPPFNQVLVWSLIESLTKQPEKVVARETSLFGNLLETKRMVVAMINKLTGSPKSLERVKVRQSIRFDWLHSRLRVSTNTFETSRLDNPTSTPVVYFLHRFLVPERD